MSAVELATAYVSLVPTAKGIQGALAAQMTPAAEAAGTEAGEAAGAKTVSGLGSSLKGVAKVMAGAFVVEKGFDFFKDATNDAIAYNKTAALTAAAIKSTGGAAGVTTAGVQELSEKLSLQTGVTETNTQAVANMLLRFTDIKNVGADKVFDDTTQAVLDMAQATGHDGASTALQLGKALQDPIGQLGALSRAGVTFTASQSASIKAMVSSNNLLGAQKAILGQVEKSYGGAAAAAATPQEKLTAAMEDLRVKIGNFLLPILDKLAKGLASTVGWMATHTTDVKIMAVAVGVLVTAFAVNKILEWGAAIKESALVTKTATAIQWLFNAAMDANPITLVVIAIAALVAAFVVAYTQSATFRDIIQAAFSAIKAAAADVADFFTVDIPAAFNWIINAGQAVWDWFKANWPLVGEIIIAVFLPGGIIIAAILHFHDQIIGFFVDVWTHIKDGVTDAVGWVTGKFDSLVAFVAGLPSRFTGAVVGLFDGARNLAADAHDWITGKFNDLVSFVSGLPSKIAGFFKGVWNNLGDDLKSAINSLLHLPLKIPKVTIGAFGHNVTIGGETLIPHLAKGGVVQPQTGGTLALLAEAGKAEVVSPLNTLQDMLDDSAAKHAGNGGATVNGPLIGNVQLSEQVDADVLAKRLDFSLRMMGLGAFGGATA